MMPAVALKPIGVLRTRKLLILVKQYRLPCIASSLSALAWPGDDNSVT